MTVDLRADGPHALVAGTTGAGKSELLRTWIAGLAASCSPEALNLVLIDFKGGSAFDIAADLPHTVAVVSDLDGDLAERALRSLQAELRRREQVLRDAGAAAIDDLWARDATTGPAALARLVVVVDEFAGLAAELPEFLSSLVGIAQRGRSLGVHLVLATQRPSGVVNDQIRANTNIRIALRVQDAHDALDVVGVADPAALDRHLAGRACLRLGRGDVALVQSAYAATVEPARRPDPVVTTDGPDRAGRSDLDRLVAACRTAAGWLGAAPPHSPWCPPLPDRIDPVDLPTLATASRGAGDDAAADTVPFLLVDDPNHQARQVGGWAPRDGNLAVVGTRGSGTTGALVAALLAAFDRWDPDELHAYVIGDDPALTALQGPHVGAVVRHTETERRTRLLARLDAELTARRQHRSDAAVPRIVLAIDGIGSLRAGLDSGGSVGEDADRLQRIVTDGPGHGLWCVVTAEHPAELPHRLLASFTQRIVLRLADPLDARVLGTAAVHGPPGRGRLAACGRLVQIVDPAGSRAERATAPAPGRRPPWTVTVLPDRVTTEDLDRAAGGRPDTADEAVTGSGAEDPPLHVLVGLGGIEIRPHGWHLRAGDGALVAGPSRSGRSTVLAQVAARLTGRAAMVAVVPRPSPLAAVPGLATVTALDRDLLAMGDATAVPRSGPGRRDGRAVPRVLLVDDAELVDDPGGVVAAALAQDWIVVTAGRSDALRSSFGHWSRAVRHSRTGLLLRPDADLDGDLLGVRLPRRSEAPLDRPGRGFLVDGGRSPILIQAGLPS